MEKYQVEGEIIHTKRDPAEDNAQAGDYMREELTKLGLSPEEIKRHVFKAGQEHASTFFSVDGEKETALDHSKKYVEKLRMEGQKPSVEKPKSPELTRERLANMQTLEVEIGGDFNSVLQSIRESTGANLEPRPDGFHLTIIGPTESKILNTLDDATVAELKEINEQIQRGEGVNVKGIGFIDGASPQYQMREVDKVKKTAFVALDIPALQKFRSKAGLPPKDFHVTLGFEGGDIHMQVLRREPIKPGSPNMKDITGPIPKQADPRFSEVALPKISYGGLDGQMKQKK